MVHKHDQIQKRSDTEKNIAFFATCIIDFQQLLYLSSEMSPSFVLPHLIQGQDWLLGLQQVNDTNDNQ